MIMKRLAERIRNQDWFVVSIEVMTVVVGLFIGLQVDDWNEGRKDQQELFEYYGRLEDDLVNDIAQMQSVETYYNQVRLHGTRALDNLSDGHETWGEGMIVDLYQASQLNTAAFNRSTFNEMMATGYIVKIPSINLRHDLATYYSTLDANEEINLTNSLYRTQIRAGYDVHLREQILVSCQDIVTISAALSPEYALPEDCAPSMDGVLVERQLDWLEGSRDLKENLQLHMNYVDILLEQLKVNIILARTTLDSLRSARGDQ